MYEQIFSAAPDTTVWSSVTAPWTVSQMHAGAATGPVGLARTLEVPMARRAMMELANFIVSVVYGLASVEVWVRVCA